MLNKHRIFIVVCMIIGILAIAGYEYAPGGATAALQPKTSEDGKAQTAEPNASFYEQCYAKAWTQEQVDALDVLVADKSKGLGEWKRDALMIIGELPEDMPRLTVKDAGKIIDKGMSEGENIAYFNDIAGAPDWQGGSGIETAVYYLDDEHTAAITCSLDMIQYLVYDGEGNATRLPIGDQVLPEPGETKSKD